MKYYRGLIIDEYADNGEDFDEYITEIAECNIRGCNIRGCNIRVGDINFIFVVITR